MDFDAFFYLATQNERGPFPYQGCFAQAAELPELVHPPTGAGKTVTAILGWPWRLLHSGRSTPRRLVYCLPMRVLVEQTRDAVILWLHRLGLLDVPDGFDPDNPAHRKNYRPLLNDSTRNKI